MEIKGEGRVNLLHFGGILSSFRTLLFSQIVIYFLQIVFQSLLQSSSVSILLFFVQ